MGVAICLTSTLSAFAASASACVMWPFSSIASSTAARRSFAAAGFCTGSYAEGSCGRPARRAIWPSVS